MSIYATWLGIFDERLLAAEMEAEGISYEVVGEAPPEAYDAPIVYQGSHILPSDDDRRGGSVDVAAIPNHITRTDRDDLPEGTLKDWLRLMVSSVNSDELGQDGTPYQKAGHAAVVLTRSQVERLRDTLTEWLEREAGPETPEQIEEQVQQIEAIAEALKEDE